MEYEQSTTTSPKRKLRQTLCNYCCFRHHGHEIIPSTPPSSSDDDSPRLSRSSSAWLRSRSHEFPELKYKCRHLISRIVGSSRRHTSPVDFRYDPLSYALNFDEGFEDGYVNGAPFRTFSERLPALETVVEEDGRVKQSLPRAISCA